MDITNELMEEILLSVDRRYDEHVKNNPEIIAQEVQYVTLKDHTPESVTRNLDLSLATLESSRTQGTYTLLRNIDDTESLLFEAFSEKESTPALYVSYSKRGLQVVDRYKQCADRALVSRYISLADHSRLRNTYDRLRKYFKAYEKGQEAVDEFRAKEIDRAVSRMQEIKAEQTQVTKEIQDTLNKLRATPGLEASLKKKLEDIADSTAMQTLH